MFYNGHTQDTTSPGPHLADAGLWRSAHKAHPATCLELQKRELALAPPVTRACKGVWVVLGLTDCMLNLLAGSLETQV